MQHLPSSAEAVNLPPSLRAAAARRDAQFCRDISERILTEVRVPFRDPIFDAAHRIAQLCRDAAAECDRAADRFDEYAADDLLHEVAS